MRVTFEDVHVELGRSPILHGVSATAPAGVVTGLLGPNGSGKSTLLRTAYRALAPGRGRVLVQDRDVRTMAGRQVARTMAVMLQDAHSDIDLTVLDLVLLGRAPHRRSFGEDTAEDLAIAAAALRRTGTEDLADRMLPTLSGGQRQRVMLARALAQRTPVLLLDEPSNHLDISHQLDLMQIVHEVDATVVAALHDLNLALTFCEHVIVLDAGRVRAEGPPLEVLTPQLVREVFGVDARLLGDTDPALAFRPLPLPRRRIPTP
jgi:iron complex transport system ATP-binding protein